MDQAKLFGARFRDVCQCSSTKGASSIMGTRSFSCLLILGFTCCDGLVSRHTSNSLGDNVDVLFSADKRMMVGLRTAAYSTVKSARNPKRLRLHIAVDHDEADAFRETFGLQPNQTKRSLPRGSETSRGEKENVNIQ